MVRPRVRPLEPVSVQLPPVRVEPHLHLALQTIAPTTITAPPSSRASRRKNCVMRPIIAAA